MQRYQLYARTYDRLSGEWCYRLGREVGIEALGLRRGDRVLDLGCGTGLNFPRLCAAVGDQGRVVGVDLSRAMLDQAARRVARSGWPMVDLVQANAARLGPAQMPVHLRDGARPPFDAVLFTYALSLVPDWPRAWRGATALVREGGRACVVDMQRPTGSARWLTPLAWAACALGGADIDARPWRMLEAEAADVQAWSLRGGHVQVRVGSLRSAQT